MSDNNPIKVLVVGAAAEEKSSIRKGLAELEERSFEVYAVPSLEEVSRQTKEIEFDLFVLDVSDESVNFAFREEGDEKLVEMIESLHQLDPRVAVVCVLNPDDDDLGLRLIDLGAQAYISREEVSSAFFPQVLRYASRIRREQLRLKRENEAIEKAVERRELGLAGNYDRLGLITDAIIDYAIFTLDDSGRVLSWSEGARRSFGYRTNEIKGKHFSRIFDEASRKKGIPERALQLAKEFGKTELRGVRVRADGSVFQGSSVIRYLSQDYGTDRELNGNQANGHPSSRDSYVFVSRDITGAIQNQKRALETERLAAIGQMVTGLAHESRNALQRIQASINRIARRTRDLPEIEGMLGDIEQAGDDLRNSYEAVRQFAAPIRLHRKKRSLLEIWHQAVKRANPLLKGRVVEFREDLGCEDVIASVDEKWMAQAFYHLLENSLAACSDPVEIKFSCRAATKVNPASLEVSVQDSGPGFSQEARSNALKVFYTSKQKGVGLGLAMVKRVVDAHGGRVELGREASGAEVVLVIPTEISESSLQKAFGLEGEVV